MSITKVGVDMMDNTSFFKHLVALIENENLEV